MADLPPPTPPSPDQHTGSDHRDHPTRRDPQHCSGVTDRQPIRVHRRHRQRHRTPLPPRLRPFIGIVVDFHRSSTGASSYLARGVPKLSPSYKASMPSPGGLCVETPPADQFPRQLHKRKLRKTSPAYRIRSRDAANGAPASTLPQGWRVFADVDRHRISGDSYLGGRVRCRAIPEGTLRDTYQYVGNNRALRSCISGRRWF